MAPLWRLPSLEYCDNTRPLSTPHIHDFTAHLSGSTIFSKIRVAEKDVEKTPVSRAGFCRRLHR